MAKRNTTAPAAPTTRRPRIGKTGGKKGKGAPTTAAAEQTETAPAPAADTTHESEVVEVAPEVLEAARAAQAEEAPPPTAELAPNPLANLRERLQKALTGGREDLPTYEDEDGGKIPQWGRSFLSGEPGTSRDDDKPGWRYKVPLHASCLRFLVGPKGVNGTVAAFGDGKTRASLLVKALWFLGVSTRPQDKIKKPGGDGKEYVQECTYLEAVIKAVNTSLSREAFRLVDFHELRVLVEKEEATFERKRRERKEAQERGGANAAGLAEALSALGGLKTRMGTGENGKALQSVKPTTPVPAASAPAKPQKPKGI